MVWKSVPKEKHAYTKLGIHEVGNTGCLLKHGVTNPTTIQEALSKAGSQIGRKPVSKIIVRLQGNDPIKDIAKIRKGRGGRRKNKSAREGAALVENIAGRDRGNPENADPAMRR